MTEDPSPCHADCVISTTQAMSLFMRERAAFSAVFPRAARSSLQVVDRHCLESGCGIRNVADANVSTGRIRVVRRLLDMGKSVFVGVIRHELGHVCDSHIDAPEAEARADAIAMLVTGEAIRYDTSLVQTTSSGEWPRPRRLHR